MYIDDIYQNGRLWVAHNSINKLNLKKYFQSGEINSEVADKDAKLKEIEEKYKHADKILHLDGVSFYFKDWWFNVRPSNTEPLLRLNLEADTKELMEEKRDEVLALIRE